MESLKWVVKPQETKEKITHLSKALGISNSLAGLLIQRGVHNFEDAKSFFRSSLDKLPNPNLMKGMEKAVSHILNSIEKKQTILVYGDYDVDGTTSVALVYSYLKSFYKNILTYIPDRHREGYGISTQGIDFAEKNAASLIIALDCGIKAIEQVTYASKKGIDFIICDHHQPDDEIPKAIAILNPKQKDCSYPFKELCGCGVGFKLIQAIHSQRNLPFDDLVPYLDLVALAIAADIVPIIEENRILATFGLKVINLNPRVAFQKLQGAKKNITIEGLVFGIAPRINAAGRIDHGNRAVELLTSTHEEEIQSTALHIEQLNSERKLLDKKITDEALQQIKENNEQQNFSTVVCAKNWHKGVIGIVASRLIENYYRPTIVFTKQDDFLVASARSIKGVNLYTLLKSCESYLEKFGGHPMAAGLLIKEENYTAFKNAFEKEVKKVLNAIKPEKELIIDTLISLSEITPKFFRILKQFAPFGPQNMNPVFISNQVEAIYPNTVGEDKTHLKMTVVQDGVKMDAIAFGLGHKYPLVEHHKKINIAYTLSENNWNGESKIQLSIKDIKSS